MLLRLIFDAMRIWARQFARSATWIAFMVMVVAMVVDIKLKMIGDSVFPPERYFASFAVILSTSLLLWLVSVATLVWLTRSDVASAWPLSRGGLAGWGLVSWAAIALVGSGAGYLVRPNSSLATSEWYWLVFAIIEGCATFLILSAISAYALSGRLQFPGRLDLSPGFAAWFAAYVLVFVAFLFAQKSLNGGAYGDFRESLPITQLTLLAAVERTVRSLIPVTFAVAAVLSQRVDEPADAFA